MADSISAERAEAIKQTIEASRECVMSRIAAATKIAEAEVIEIGTLLNEIVNVATADNTDVIDSLDMLSGERETTVTRGIQQQTETVSGFIEDVCERLDSQRVRVDGATSLCGDISEAVKAIETVTRKSHLLAWNISIEAARLGSQGKAVATIGSSMGDFTNEISDATKKIVDMLERLTKTLPSLSEASAELSETASTFSGELGTSLAEIEHNVGELGDRLRQGVEEAGQRNETVQRLTYQTLSHLAFQDPVAQQLLRSEHELRDMSQHISGIIDYKIDSDSLDYATHCGNDTCDVEQESGVVDLF